MCLFQDKEQSDEKFIELEAKIQEYADLIAGDQTKKSVLPAIEERYFLEKTVNYSTIVI